MSGLPLGALLAVFLAGATVIWRAGSTLSDATDILDERLGLGSALGGVVLLAVVTNLPEIAVTITAAVSGHIEIAVSNILGGIAIQTLVLALIDFGAPDEPPITYRAATLVLVLEAATVIAVLLVVVMGAQLPAATSLGPFSPASLVIVAVWVGGVLIVARARSGLPWQAAGEAPGNQLEPYGYAQREKDRAARKAGVTTRAVVTRFASAALLTLIAGVILEQAGEAAAGDVGLSGVIFGATVLAAATAIPELATGRASIELGDDQLAMSDILGGNAFLPVLFAVADLLVGSPTLSLAKDSDVYLTALGALLTAVYAVGLILRPERRFCGSDLTQRSS